MKVDRSNKYSLNIGSFSTTPSWKLGDALGPLNGAVFSGPTDPTSSGCTQLSFFGW